jgi:hypothetical protein
VYPENFYRSGFYETAGKSQDFSFVGRFFFSLVRVSIHLGASIRTLMNLKGSVHFGVRY